MVRLALLATLFLVFAAPEATHAQQACGDGTLDAGEECDDGNTTGRDGCSYDCKEECPTACTAWFDGCNECTCSDSGIQFCTLRFCLPEEIESSMCLEFTAQCGDGACTPPEDENSCPRDCTEPDSAGCTPWPDGLVSLHCGRGGDGPCPPDSECIVHPADRYAVCQPLLDQGFCPAPPDLTGTWEGKLVCKSIRQGEKAKDTDKTAILEISDDRNLGLRVRLNGAPFAGVATATAKAPHKGSLTLTRCTTAAGESEAFDEVASGGFTVTDSKATIRGKSAWRAGNPISGDHVAAAGGSCTFSFKRVDPANPDLVPCP